MSPTPGMTKDDPSQHQRNEEDIEAMETPQFNVAAGSTDEESDEENGPEGYVMLPQGPESDDDSEGMEEGAMGGTECGEEAMDHTSFDKAGFQFQLPDIESAETEERKEVWRPAKTDHEPLDSEQVDKIKVAMSSISLPKLSIPDWARVVPEEEWKAKLFAKMKTPTNNSTSQKGHPSSSNEKNKDGHKERQKENHHSEDT